MHTDPTDMSAARATFVHIYLLPVRAANLDAYREQAAAFGSVAREHGALSYREFRGDDLRAGFAVQEGQVLTAAVVEFESRGHRDAVMAKVVQDPRVTQVGEGEEVADMERMRYGGFEVFVQA